MFWYANQALSYCIKALWRGRPLDLNVIGVVFFPLAPHPGSAPLPSPPSLSHTGMKMEKELGVRIMKLAADEMGLPHTSERPLDLDVQELV